MISFLRRFPLTSLVTAVLTLGMVSGLGADLVGAEESPHATQLLQCEPGVLIVHMKADLGADTEGGPATSREAVDDFLLREYPHTAPTLSEHDVRSDNATFTSDLGGATALVVSARFHGDSWHVTEMAACENYLHVGSER